MKITFEMDNLQDLIEKSVSENIEEAVKSQVEDTIKEQVAKLGGDIISEVVTKNFNEFVNDYITNTKITVRKEDFWGDADVNEYTVEEYIKKCLKERLDNEKFKTKDKYGHINEISFSEYMDYSGSMDWLFDNGSVQKTVSRLLPIALRFDDNGELESWLFSNGCKRLKAVTENNYSNYVKKVMKKSGMYMGGTEYAPVLDEVVTYYKDIEPSEIVDDDNVVHRIGDCSKFTVCRIYLLQRRL